MFGHVWRRTWRANLELCSSGAMFKLYAQVSRPLHFLVQWLLMRCLASCFGDIHKQGQLLAWLQVLRLFQLVPFHDVIDIDRKFISNARK